MNPSDKVVHTATVKSINNGIAHIFFEQAGCSSCSVRTSCGMADGANKMIEVPVKNRDLKVGEEVMLHVSNQNGYKAVVLSYFLPFIIVAGSLMVLISAGVAEPLAGLISLSTAIPYFFLLKILNRRIAKNIRIDIEQYE